MEVLANSFDTDTLRLIDLNKIVVFMVVYRERSASGAAVQLGIKQPAVSNTLSVLRRLFNDELFLRVGKGLQATSRADAIFHALEPALGLISEVAKFYKSSPEEKEL